MGLAGGIGSSFLILSSRMSSSFGKSPSTSFPGNAASGRVKLR
jgi:hypothetical protein